MPVDIYRQLAPDEFNRMRKRTRPDLPAREVGFHPMRIELRRRAAAAQDDLLVALGCDEHYEHGADPAVHEVPGLSEAELIEEYQAFKARVDAQVADDRERLRRLAELRARLRRPSLIQRALGMLGMNR